MGLTTSAPISEQRDSVPVQGEEPAAEEELKDCMPAAAPNTGLTNSIHPLWAPERFEPGNDYEIIRSAAQFCSRISQTPQFRHYFFALFFGVNQAVKPSKWFKTCPPQWRP